MWTGSTNITLAGIFGQCNTGHWIKDEKVAQQYFTYWSKIKDNPAMSDLANVSEQIQPDTDLTQLKKGSYVFFSPRHTTNHLTKYMELLDSATEMVCMIFPFNIDDVFLTEFRKDKNFLRLLLFEHSAEAQSVKSNDIDVKVTAGAVYTGNEKEWAKEITSKATTGAGILYVHNKFFIIDGLSDNPKILTGSANFSKPSIIDNDENSILIVGDKRVADIYLTEFSRLFDHFWPRYLDSLKNKNITEKKGFDAPLDETYKWFQDYYDPIKFVAKRKEMFKKMKGAKKS